MIENILSYSKKNKMIEKGDRIVVGLSGGADSVCLLYLLVECFNSYIDKLIAVHVNHGLRGSQADQDELFVQELCKDIGIECYSLREDVRKVARVNGLSEEEAGRNVRYDAFIKVCLEHKCNKIAVAHNRNDNAETMLFNLFRGSGINGLTGIEPMRKIREGKKEPIIIRPLIETGRDEIEEYLKRRNISYIVDKTNLENDYSRNKIRNQVLTFVTDELNSNAINNISNATYHLREIRDYIDEKVKDSYDKVVNEEEGVFIIEFKKMENEHSYIRKAIIMEILSKLSGSRRDLQLKHVEQVLGLKDKQVGRQIDLPGGIIALRSYDELSIYRYMDGTLKKETQEEDFKPLIVQIPGSNILPYNKKIETEIIIRNKDETIPNNSCIKWFDYDRIENTVEIRTRRAGDYIQINAQGGRKKLKDYFIDLKVPAKERSSRLLVADGNHIMWILGDGNRISEKYKINKDTRNILEMKLIEEKENSHG